jgi:branched-chain amino acid transport system ATP-binding protein
MLLDVRELDVRYGRVHAVRGVSLGVAAGEIVAVLGANGAGKSSLLRALLGVERIAGGRVLFDGIDISSAPASRRIEAGLVLVPEGRRVVRNLTVHENLLMGAFNRRDGARVREEIDALYGRFPNLAARRHNPASVLSGGEQQMLAIGRALVAAPKLIMLDEPSLGLSPRLTNEVFAHIAELNRARGLTMLLVEQSTHRALALADRAYVFELGRMVCAGTPTEILADGRLVDAYLGRGPQGRRLTAGARREAESLDDWRATP